MKKVLVGVTMVLALALVANVAFSDETVPFPFWQHGWSIMAFWSVTNAGTQPCTVTIQMLQTDGSLHCSTTSTIQPDNAWQPFSGDTSWYDCGNGLGWGKYIVQSTEDATYLWGAVLADLGNSQPGYTIILPGNPYGIPGV